MMTSQVVHSARLAFYENRNKPLKFREKQLKNFLKFFEDNEEAIVESVAKDVRKHPEEARTEIILCVNHLRYLIYNLYKFARREKVKKRLVDILDSLYIHREPYGVVLIMASWNVPLLTIIPAAGAIAAGNSVILKPSHLSTNFGDLLAKLLPKYIDSYAYPVFLGGIEETKQLLEEKFDYIYYTGSKVVGKLVHSAANKNLTPVTLELGGKNPCFIDDSIDLKLVAKRLVWGKFFCSGQICIAPDYILCTKDVRDKLFQYLKDVIIEFYGTNCYLPIVSEHHFNRIKTLLENLDIKYGGRVDPSTASIEPTIVFDAPLNHSIMDEEIFGPILTINLVHTVNEAIEFINSKPKSLTAYVFSEKTKVKQSFLKNTSSGSLVFNDLIMHLAAEELPFGGVGDSGMGTYKSKFSYDTFCHKKSILDKNTWALLEKINVLRYPPYSKRNTYIAGFLLTSRKGFSIPFFSYILVLLLGAVLGGIIVKYLFIQ